MGPNHIPSPEEVAAKLRFEEQLKEVHTLQFTKGELLMIFNILTQSNMLYGDFVNIDPIIKKIHPIVAVDSSQSNNAFIKDHIATGKRTND